MTKRKRPKRIMGFGMNITEHRSRAAGYRSMATGEHADVVTALQRGDCGGAMRHLVDAAKFHGALRAHYASMGERTGYPADDQDLADQRAAISACYNRKATHREVRARRK